MKFNDLRLKLAGHLMEKAQLNGKITSVYQEMLNFLNERGMVARDLELTDYVFPIEDELVSTSVIANELMEFEFSYELRGETNYYSIEFPKRYLADDGVQIMTEERRNRGSKKLKKRPSVKEAEERLEYLRLKEKYGDKEPS